ncbi:hypothetical protein NLU13_3470 [Sarocladium strictum]|uniref:N-acetylglucosaminylphosphatidylinositol deacetylase n=1 Tax=Sarocladium strictum TaxID=5046 RepID=A0AA39LAA2_SARSR|nr:hypothetical protein NLU13_3470 [Sarocladium strictum]
MKTQLHRVAWKLRQVCFANRRRRTAIVRGAIILFVFPILLQLFLAYFVGSSNGLAPLGLSQAKNVLLVTAHPDDECLFFSPTLLGILDSYPSIKGGLLVLSTGNNYGLGDVRNQELKGSCQALRIDPSRCLTQNHPDLQDDPTKWWDSTKIQDVVKGFVKKWEIDAIITFDNGGVSGHVNHRAISEAMRSYAKSDTSAPPVFELVTTSLIRKYTFLWDLPLTTLLFIGLVVNTWSQYMATRTAFASHASQYTWDRNVYMVLSRYVWFNTLRRVG